MEKWQLKNVREIIDFGEMSFYYDKKDFFLVHVDDRFCDMLGFNQTELRNYCRNRASELIMEQDYEATREAIINGIDSKGKYTCDYRVRRKDGIVIYVRESGSLTMDEEGNPIVRCIMQDITQYEIIKKERDAIFNNVPGGVVTMLVTDSNFYITEANDQFFLMFGSNRDEYIGSSGMYMFPEDLHGFRNYVTDKAKNKEALEYEFRTRATQGTGFRWYRMYGRFYDEVEDGCEYMCSLVDITERKKNVFEIQKEKERYRIAMEIMASVVFEYDLDTLYWRVYTNEKMGDAMPVLRDGEIGTWDEIFYEKGLIHEDDVKNIPPRGGAERSISKEVRMMTRNREGKRLGYQWFRLDATKVWERGKVARVVGSIINIEESKKKRKESGELNDILQRQSLRLYEVVLKIEVESGGVKGYILDGNSFDNVYGEIHLFEQYIEYNAEKYVHPDDYERFIYCFELANMKDILDHSKVEEVVFFRIRKDGGEYRHKCIRYSYLDGNENTIVLLSQDVHQMREVELKLEDANRKIIANAINETKDTVEMRRNFVAMLTRELGAPLQNMADGLRKYASLEGMDGIRNSLSYVRNVLDNIAEYDRVDQGNIQLENSRFVLREKMEELLFLWKNRMELTGTGVVIEYHINLLQEYYYGDALRIGQVVTNVLGNCIKAVESDKRIQVWISDQQQERNMNKLTMVFEDRGIPINEYFFGRSYPMGIQDVRQRMTENREQEGTEFSLILARRLVELMGGQLLLKKSEDNINQIVVELPVSVSQEEKSKLQVGIPEERETTPPNLRNYSILLVENGKQLDKMVAPFLKLCGARVDVTASGMDALKVWNSYPENMFDAVLVGEKLADMDYLEFTEMFRTVGEHEAKSVLVIAMVDNVRQESLGVGMQLGVNAILDKPVNLKHLKQVLDMNKYRLDEEKPADY